MSREGFVPQEIEDAVVLWARTYGREAKLGYHRIMKCYAIQLSSPPDDPKWAAYREGRLKVPPHEFIPLHRQNGGHFEALSLEELGASGIVALLEEANLWSGRGEYSSLKEAMEAVAAQNEATREHYLAQVEEVAKEMAWLHRRRIFGLPLESVDVDLNNQGAAEQTPPQ